MNIKDLAKEPQLIPLTIDDEKIVSKYGEAITLHIYDRQPLDIFAKLSVINEDNATEIAKLVEGLILDEQGNKIVSGKNTLPIDVLVAAMGAISEVLGK